ncbi:MAG: hypothetical protein ACKOVA_09550 [Novosphingobium sp.]
MAEAHQEELNAEQIDAIYRAISPERIGKYLIAAGHHPHRAMLLYIWNARIGEAFHLPIQAVEVALRNCVNAALIAQFGTKWWLNPTYLSLIDHDRHADLDAVRRRIRNRNQREDIGQIVASLSFGFWVGMLQPRYNPDLWSRQIRHAFPYLPDGKSRKSLANAAGKIATLRNRISHHEPLIARDHSADYKLVMELLHWLCPHKMEWILPHCRVPQVIREKP